MSGSRQRKIKEAAKKAYEDFPYKGTMPFEWFFKLFKKDMKRGRA